MSTRQVVLVGMVNPYGDSPAMALYDEPPGASGDRLRRILGLERGPYRALVRVNLCVGRWALDAARRRARELQWAHPGACFVLLGRDVQLAFRCAGEFFTTADLLRDGVAVRLSHPSGLSRVYDAPGAIARARAVLKAQAPDLPLGEAEDAIPVVSTVDAPHCWMDGDDDAAT